jgi:uncharacterized protein
MRVVADTNIVISGLLWPGPLRQVLQAAHREALTLFSSAVLLVELEEVLSRPRLAQRLNMAGVPVEDLVRNYAAVAQVVQPPDIGPVIAADPDDDAVLACAVGPQAEAIVSGDHHLLQLGQY